jgi:hypothetical protein
MFNDRQPVCRKLLALKFLCGTALSDLINALSILFMQFGTDGQVLADTADGTVHLRSTAARDRLWKYSAPVDQRRSVQTLLHSNEKNDTSGYNDMMVD